MAVDSRAIAFGLAVFLCLHISYLFLETAIKDALLPMVWLFFATPVLAGVVTGHFARRRPFVSLLVLGVLVAICVSALHLLWPWLGLRADMAPGQGVAALGVMSLMFMLPLVIVGGAVGVALPRAKA